MPAIKCENGKYKWGRNGRCIYDSAQEAEQANKSMKAKDMKKTKDAQFFHMGFKPIPVEGKEAKAEDGVKVSGYASTPTPDRYDDIVEPTAFVRSIMNEYKKNPIVLFQHNSDRPIGIVTHMSIDDQGLFVEATIHDEEVGPKVAKRILRTFSIGFIARAIEFRDENGQLLNPAEDNIWREGVKRVITDVDLVEISVVSVPANPDALFTVEKSVKSFFKNYSLNPDSMKKKNLLTMKAEDDAVVETVESAESVETVESVDTEEVIETPADEQGGTEEAEIETPADETSGEGEVVETDGKDEAESVEDDKGVMEAHDRAYTKDGESEDKSEGEDDDTAEDGGDKKTLAISPELLTKENFIALAKKVSDLTAENAKLTKKLGEPAKRAMVYSESKLASIEDEQKADAKNQEKTGFKEMLMQAAN